MLKHAFEKMKPTVAYQSRILRSIERRHAPSGSYDHIMGERYILQSLPFRPMQYRIKRYFSSNSGGFLPGRHIDPSLEKKTFTFAQGIAELKRIEAEHEREHPDEPSQDAYEAQFIKYRPVFALKPSA